MRILSVLGASTWDSTQKKRSSSRMSTHTECRVTEPPLAGSSLGCWRNNLVVTHAVRVNSVRARAVHGFRRKGAIDEREEVETQSRGDSPAGGLCLRR